MQRQIIGPAKRSQLASFVPISVCVLTFYLIKRFSPNCGQVFVVNLRKREIVKRRVACQNVIDCSDDLMCFQWFSVDAKEIEFSGRFLG